ncbi:hypothetical protein JCM17380_46890 [Desulfosporosinus burensis]
MTSNSYDWVTKAKRNTAIYRRVIKPWSGQERFVSINARMLIKEIFPQLKIQGPGLVSVAVPDIYMKMPYKVTNKKGKVVTKQRFTPIAAVVAMNLKEDEDQTKENVVEADIKEKTSDGEGFTHGEMVSSLFHTRCEVRLKTRKGIQ